jgi:hypothetical protein
MVKKVGRDIENCFLQNFFQVNRTVIKDMIHKNILAHGENSSSI